MLNIAKVCPISGDNMKPLFKERILGKYDIQYYISNESGLIQTEKPFWFEEAYSHAITKLDIGLVYRNLLHSKVLEPFLAYISTGTTRLLDIGGGFGLLTRLLRDKGFNVFTHDPYCENIFAKNFEPGKDFKADALFAFEVFEHLEDPVQFLEQAFAKYHCKTIFFSTVTFNGKAPEKNWWYYSFETGQHISLYQPKSLSMLAKKFNCHYYQLYGSFHLITDKKINPFVLMAYKNGGIFRVVHFFTRLLRGNKSLLVKDYNSIKEALQKSFK